MLRIYRNKKNNEKTIKVDGDNENNYNLYKEIHMKRKHEKLKSLQRDRNYGALLYSHDYYLGDGPFWPNGLNGPFRGLLPLGGPLNGPFNETFEGPYGPNGPSNGPSGVFNGLLGPFNPHGTHGGLLDEHSGGLHGPNPLRAHGLLNDPFSGPLSPSFDRCSRLKDRANIFENLYNGVARLGTFLKKIVSD